MSLKGQAALVVGGASGIGLATVKELLREGANVVVSDVTDSGEVVVKELQAEFGPQSSIFVKADVRDDAQLEDAFSLTKKQFKRLDIFVNSAGIVNDVEWDREVDINLKGVIRGTLLAWKYMGKHEGGNGGSVINLSSFAALVASHVCPIYTATKIGVIGFSRCAGEPYHVNRTGVRVMTVCPGQTDTPLVNQLVVLTKELGEEMSKQVENRYTQPASHVAKGIVEVIQSAKSGSVWISEDGKPEWEVAFPAYQDMRAKP